MSQIKSLHLGSNVPCNKSSQQLQGSLNRSLLRARRIPQRQNLKRFSSEGESPRIPTQDPYGAVPLEELKDRLELTIRGEDYKSAAGIRDEIKRRENNVEIAVGNVHQAFYKAFESGDYKAMESLWGDGSHVQIIHPGCDAIRGRPSVMESWQIIFNGGRFNIELEQVQIHAVDNLAFVTCVEVMRSPTAKGRTAATNVLEKQNGRWVMVHHQGGPTLGKA